MAERRFEPFCLKRVCLKRWNEKVPGESFEIQILIVSATKAESHVVIEKDKTVKTLWIYGYWKPPPNYFLNWFFPKPKESSLSAEISLKKKSAVLGI